MKNRGRIQSAGFVQSRKVAPSLPFLAKGGRKLNGLEPIVAGRAAVTPGATVTRVVGARQASSYVDYPCTTQAQHGMEAAARWHKGNCEAHLGGQERNGRWLTFRQRQLPTVMVRTGFLDAASSPIELRYE